MDAGFFRAWIAEIAAVVEAQRDHLTQLDSAIGDADHGINLARGFGAVQGALADADTPTPASVLLLTGYALHTSGMAHPLLRLVLFRIRTFRSAVVGSFFTRLGIGGIPFLFPLLYQIGLGFTPIQSGLLMMPQALAAMSLKLTMPAILARFGYRTVLISNTVILGLMIMLFATIGAATPVWLIVLQLFCFGFFTSLQYTSMNTLVYADVRDELSSNASTIASTMQQMSVSFGVACASLATAVFIPDRFNSSAPQMIHGIHQAFLLLGGLTVLTAVIFHSLKNDDGGAVSRHKTQPPNA